MFGLRVSPDHTIVRDRSGIPVVKIETPRAVDLAFVHCGFPYHARIPLFLWNEKFSILQGEGHEASNINLWIHLGGRRKATARKIQTPATLSLIALLIVEKEPAGERFILL